MKVKHYKFAIVGSGLFGGVCCKELREYFPDSTIIVYEKRNHIGGNIYTKKIHNIDVHKYGPHIFHTNDDNIWNYINNIDEFIPYIQETLAIDKYNNIYHLPFNMNTFYDIYKASTIKKAKECIEKAKVKYDDPQNLEEFALSTVGMDIYNLLIKEYTEKQWGKQCNELSKDIIQRLPLRFEFNNNYFNDKYQGIPKNGYTYIIEKLLTYANKIYNNYKFTKEDIYKYDYIIYCGAVDELFDYKLGELEWRSLEFKNEYTTIDNTQGCAIINNVSKNVKYTRTIEHHYFNKYNKPLNDIIIRTKEYPCEYERGLERYYPINNEKNNLLYYRYVELCKSKYPNIILGGRLGLYKYNDMDDTIIDALKISKELHERISFTIG